MFCNARFEVRIVQNKNGDTPTTNSRCGMSGSERLGKSAVAVAFTAFYLLTNPGKEATIYSIARRTRSLMVDRTLSVICRHDADAYYDEEKRTIVLTNGSRMYIRGGEE